MLYQLVNATVTAAGEPILSHVDFEIKGKEKIAVVGRNGAGKTTLLNLIAGELVPDRDDKRQGSAIRKSRQVTIGMLKQTQDHDLTKTVEEILRSCSPSSDPFSREMYEYEVEYNRLFTGFGLSLSDKEKKLSEFSGGEQTKIALIRLLLMKPDILLLDEPTNHLDIQTVEWLEEYLKSYEHAVVFVSHDRFFLDQVAEVVYELENQKLRRYSGGYTDYRKEKLRSIAAAKKAWERQEEEVKRLNDLIEKFKNKPKKAAFARSRKKILERMELMEKPCEDEAHIFTGEILPEIPGSKWVLEAEHLKIGYEEAILELALKVRKGQKIGILGENGAGKSTFLKTIHGDIAKISGKCTLGNNTVMGYFDQHTSEINSEKNVYDHFHDRFPSLLQKESRSILANYLFKGKLAQTMVKDLSGGEKSRLVLAEILQSRPNLLLLDEPTNHMDIPAKETLESAFKAYTGTILFVSHDRYFLSQVADALLIFENGRASYYPFGYQHYLERLRRAEKYGSSMAMMVQAEDQALIADMRAVPKKDTGYLREEGTDAAYADWQMRLAKEPLEKSRREMEKAEEMLKLHFEEILTDLEAEQMPDSDLTAEERDLTDAEDPAITILREVEEEKKRYLSEYQEAADAFTKACLDWYQIYEQIFEL
ncbi:MAG: ATP-binding cassette domain-containing protein [Dorea sp.]|nr:ATP-binding cassette domain-containing protein [Dorea sp.]